MTGLYNSTGFSFGVYRKHLISIRHTQFENNIHILNTVETKRRIQITIWQYMLVINM